jgi:hypothetical protein
MEQERENQKSIEREIRDDDQPVEGNQLATEFTEPSPEEAEESAESEFESDLATTHDDESENDLDTDSDISEEEKGAPQSEMKNPESETPVHDVSEEKSPASDAEASGDIKDAAEKAGVKDDSGDQVEPGKTKANSTDRTQKRSSLSKLAFSIILMFVVIAVLLAYAKPWHQRLKKEPQPPFPQADVQAPEKILVASDPQPTEPEQNDPYQIYRAKLRDLNRQREALLIKKHEIGELKKHYRAGIKTLENEILQEALRKNIHTFEKALKNKRIELKIRAIQRRLVYINKLDGPLKWLEQGSEALLYLKRKASFDLQVVEIVNGIDMDMHMQEINAALQKYRLTADNLAINPQEAIALPLESLWKGLYSKTKNNPHLLADIENWFIEQEICSGNLKRSGELTIISTEAARCIAQMEGSDLFLNGIEDLSPTIARQLCQWRGKWICLNGVKMLSPSAAKHLFQWEGEWISLNGLSAFPPELAQYLGQWKGKQLELMGLASNADHYDKKALEYMAEWEKAGGKLFVPDSIRTMIDLLKPI